MKSLAEIKNEETTELKSGDPSIAAVATVCDEAEQDRLTWQEEATKQVEVDADSKNSSLKRHF